MSALVGIWICFGGMLVFCWVVVGASTASPDEGAGVGIVGLVGAATEEEIAASTGSRLRRSGIVGLVYAGTTASRKRPLKNVVKLLVE